MEGQLVGPVLVVTAEAMEEDGGEEGRQQTLGLREGALTGVIAGRRITLHVRALGPAVAEFDVDEAGFLD